MDVTRLRYFSVIAETGSLRRASELLKVSSPALSKAVRLLEQDVGHKLVTQSGRGILITDQGHALVERSKAVLRELESLRSSISVSPESARPLRIGSFEVFTTYFLGALVRRHLSEMPIVIHDLAAGHLERALIERQVDLGITYVPVPSKELEHAPVVPIEMGVFARKGAFSSIPFAAVPFAVPVTPIAGAPDRIRGLDGWADGTVPRLIKYQVTLMESALELCRQGAAAAYLPRFVVRLHNERVAEPYRLESLPGSKSGKSERQSVYLVRRRSDVESAAFRKIAKALRVECRSANH